MGATLSTLGLYNYDKTIFDGLNVPDGMDKETLVSKILMDTAELEVIYTDPATLKFAISNWSSVCQRVWEELEATFHYDYNPIHNYDREEIYTDTEKVQRVENEDHTINYESSGSNNANQSGNTDNMRSVFGFNSESAANAEKNEGQFSSDTDTSYNDERKDTGTRSTDGNTDRTFVHSAHMLGNIGVTTTQQMIDAQRETVQFNLYDYIVTDYKNRFCLLVY